MGETTITITNGNGTVVQTVPGFSGFDNGWSKTFTVPLCPTSMTLSGTIGQAGQLDWQSVFLVAQDGYHAPAVTSLQPSTWTAGQTYSITITGSGFIPSSVATPTCLAETLIISTPSGTVIPVSNVTVDSTTQITATVAPPASEPTETATVTVNTGSAAPNATTNAQVVGCLTPTISSVSPNTWLAGETYKNVSITGSNFITDNTATAACPKSTVSFTTGTGSVTVSNVNVVSSALITAVVEPDDNDPTEPATIAVSAASNSVTAQINGLPPAIIQWNDQTISGTTQPAVVGQNIALHAEPKTPPATGFTISKSLWQVDDTNIGSINLPSGQNGFKTDPPTLNKPDTAFYWLVPNDGLNATYSYCATVPSGREICPSITKAIATFNVTGPLSAKLNTCGGYVIAPGCTATDPLADVAIGPGPKLALGDSSRQMNGIVFTASDDTSSAPGKFSYVQLLSKLNVVYSYASGGTCSINGFGLDTSYPYGSLNDYTTDDNPAAPLFAEDAEVTYSFQATMYLLWKSSGASDSILVPVGSVDWGWFGDALRDQSMRTWSVKPDGRSLGTAGSFVASPHTRNGATSSFRLILTHVSTCTYANEKGFKPEGVLSMRFVKNIVLALAAIVTIFGLVAATGTSSHPFTITISASEHAFRAGAKVRVHVMLTNISDETLNMERSPDPEKAEEHYTVLVHDKKNGKDVPKTDYGRSIREGEAIGSEIAVWLKPGESLEENVDISKLFDISYPGEYEVQLSRHISDDPKKETVESNKITIIVKTERSEQEAIEPK